MIKEQEAGLPTAVVCRKHGISPSNFYRLKAGYGGASDMRRLKSLEDEDAIFQRRASFRAGCFPCGGQVVAWSLRQGNVCMRRKSRP
ncbi:MAG: transposase [Alphaproteobacteria bacterium]|nr:transposase [Alphaproteobacteria bacterium]